MAPAKGESTLVSVPRKENVAPEIAADVRSVTDKGEDSRNPVLSGKWPRRKVNQLLYRPSQGGSDDDVTPEKTMRATYAATAHQEKIKAGFFTEMVRKI